jgi:hypothetical protein
MPHHQNTSGFFITIFLKKEAINEKVAEKSNDSGTSNVI